VVGLLITKFKKFIAEYVSDFFTSFNTWRGYKQERGCLVHFLPLLSSVVASRTKFSYINVSQGSVATYARILNNHLTAN